LTALPNVYFRKLKKGSIKPAAGGPRTSRNWKTWASAAWRTLPGNTCWTSFPAPNAAAAPTSARPGPWAGPCPQDDQHQAPGLRLPDSSGFWSPPFRAVDGRPTSNGPDRTGSGKSAAGVISTEEIWSCTTCGACEEECPVFIEYIDKMVDLRRHLTETGASPSTFNQVLTHLEKTGNPLASPQETERLGQGFGRGPGPDFETGGANRHPFLCGQLWVL